MKLHELAPAEGAKKPRKRVGRGNGSGHGTYSGRGSKGQKARSGGQVNPRFEGGQAPLVLRLPRKRGFTNIFKQQFHLVNVEGLDRFEAGSQVTPETLVEAGLIRDARLPVKLLGRGDVSKALKIHVHQWSKSAQQKVEAAGGALERVTE
ncbi:MAG: 50S ribosomal protein L15 [Chloroflexota bacterium]